MKCKILLALALLLSGGILDTEYLRAKIEKLKLFDDEHIILAVAKAVEKNCR